MSEESTKVDVYEEQSATIITRAPKACEKGVKPKGWSIELKNPFYNKTLTELAEEYGEDSITSWACAQLRVKYQAAIRTLAEAGRADDEIRERMDTWRPGDRLLQSGDVRAELFRNFSNMTPEQRIMLIERLQKIVDGQPSAEA